MNKSAKSVGHILLGRPLATDEAAHQAISKKVALAVFSSDTLSSVAYATQEILIVLTTAVAIYGVGVFWYSIPIAIAIVLLLAILTISYRQTIFAYPSGGGAYIVARDNLGEVPAMVAAAALLTDYILTVAVSVSSGVEQLASVLPGLAVYRAPISVVLVLLIMLVNLRGVKESGAVFAVPTYFFVGMAMLLIVVGFVKYFTGTLGTVQGVVAEPHPAFSGLWLFLILRAFSSGCTAVTGVEAISNGIQAFKSPKSKNAAATLVIMALLLGTMFIGITFLAQWVKAVPTELPTVISQVSNVIFEGSILHYMLVAGAILILALAANTSFADFPRLSALAAADGFCRANFPFVGAGWCSRGALRCWPGLHVCSFSLFDARVTALIPLYAIGVFMSFTLSQYGMVRHWWKAAHLKVGESIKTRFSEIHFDPTWRVKLSINALGGTVSLVVMAIFALTKFVDGAWVIVLLVPLLVLLFSRIRKHYANVARVLSLNQRTVNPVKQDVLTLVFVDDVHAGTVPMVEFAISQRHSWLAVHFDDNPDKTAIIQQKWRERMVHVHHPLLIVSAPYRNLTEVAVNYVQHQLDKDPHRLVHVIMGQLIMDNYWEQALHSNSTIGLKLALQRMGRVVVTDVSYQLHTSDAENYPVNVENNFKMPEQDEHADGQAHTDDQVPAPKPEKSPAPAAAPAIPKVH